MTSRTLAHRPPHVATRCRAEIPAYFKIACEGPTDSMKYKSIRDLERLSRANQHQQYEPMLTPLQFMFIILAVLVTPGSSANDRSVPLRRIILQCSQILLLKNALPKSNS
jgi:hypothetical protein